MNLKKYQSFVFDCDGVVLNSNKIKTQAFYDVAKVYGKEQAQALVEYHVQNGGISRYKKFEYFLSEILNKPINDDNMDKLVEHFSVEVKNALLTCEVAEGLKELRAKTPHAKWFIVSGGDQEELREVFIKRDLAELFDGGIFGSPDSKDTILKRELETVNMPQPALFLGDSKYDYKASSEAGLDFVFMSKWTEVEEWQVWCLENEILALSNLKSIISADLESTESIELIKFGNEFLSESYELSNNKDTLKLIQKTKANDLYVYKLLNIVLHDRVMFDKSRVVLQFNDIHHEKFEKLKPSKNECTIIDKNKGCYFLIDSKNADNYFHWLTQSLSSLYEIVTKFGIENNYFVFYSLSNWKREYLRFFNIPLDNVIEINREEKSFFHEINMLSLSFRHAGIAVNQGWFKIDPSSFEYRHSMIKKAQSMDLVKFDKLYISRKDAKRRAIANESEVEEFMESLGYMILQPETFTIMEQISLFNNAKIIIGPTGAAFGNLIFCQPSAKVGIIQPLDLKNKCGGYATMAGLLELEPYVYIETTSFHESKSWGINLEAFKTFVLNIENGSFISNKDIKVIEFEQKWNPQKEKNNLSPFARLEKKVKAGYKAADMLRDTGLAFEEEGDIQTALKLMQQALKLRPTGSFIKKKVDEFTKLIEGQI